LSERRIAGDLGVDVEEPGDPACRRRIEHDGVVGTGVLLVAAAYQLHGLAREQDIPQSGRDRGHEFDSAHAAQDAASPPEVVEEFEVLQERLFRIHGETPDLAPAAGGCESPFLVGERRRVEQLRESLTPLDLHEHDVATVSRQGERESGCHGRLARAALARHDVQDHVGPVVGGHHLSLVRPVALPRLSGP